jgi:hypothetical protein
MTQHQKNKFPFPETNPDGRPRLPPLPPAGRGELLPAPQRPLLSHLRSGASADGQFRQNVLPLPPRPQARQGRPQLHH